MEFFDIHDSDNIWWWVPTEFYKSFSRPAHIIDEAILYGINTLTSQSPSNSFLVSKLFDWRGRTIVTSLGCYIVNHIGLCIYLCQINHPSEKLAMFFFFFLISKLAMIFSSKKLVMTFPLKKLVMINSWHQQDILIHPQRETIQFVIFKAKFTKCIYGLQYEGLIYLRKFHLILCRYDMHVYAHLMHVRKNVCIQ